MTARAFLILLCCVFPIQAAQAQTLPTADGYRGIWYQIGNKDGPKYSGGMATYPQQIRPFAIYRKEVNKTFFVYGGTDPENKTLLHMISYYDHATGTVPRPRILLDKHTTDAHDNPCISIDDKGYIWIFSNTHGPEPRSFIHRSAQPYSIDSFEKVLQTSFSYGDPWFIKDHGFLFISNRYTDGRAVAFQTSADGYAWSKPQLLAQIKGHYAISLARGDRVGVVFNYHPHGLDTRTNLYYIQTRNFGATWTTVDGAKLITPLKEVHNPALIHNYESEHLLVYLKDIQFDAAGNPVLVYLTSKGHDPGPQNDPRTWMTARWTGKEWSLHAITTSDHNYDFGQLYIEPDGTWRLIAPTDPGPQPYMTGGEIVVWTSNDQGITWNRFKQLTHNSALNHSYVRQPIDAKDDFYAFWADGDPRKKSESDLYFTNRGGDAVWELPSKMDQAQMHPKKIEP